MTTEAGAAGTSMIAQRIVVPVDGAALAEEAFPDARSVAAPDAELVLLHVAPTKGTILPGEEPTLGWLDRTAERLRTEAGLRAEIVRDRGDPATAIVRVATERGADLIVIAGEGWRDTAKRYQGSVGDRVAREAATSVLLVPAPGHSGEGIRGEGCVRRVVVPLDGSAGAMGALSAAETVARRCAAPVWLVAAVDPADGAPPAAVADAEHAARDSLAELRGEAQRLIESAGARIMREGGAAAWQLLDGPAAAAIVGAAREGDLIVLASRGRAGGGGWPIGSVAEKVVRYSTVPVLVHRDARR